MTKREIKHFINEISPSPGYILNFTKQELADFIYEHTKLELEDYEQKGNSNAKRLATMLELVDNVDCRTITQALLNHKKENNL
jgi:hypothetical protein